MERFPRFPPDYVPEIPHTHSELAALRRDKRARLIEAARPWLWGAAVVAFVLFLLVRRC